MVGRSSAEHGGAMSEVAEVASMRTKGVLCTLSTGRAWPAWP
jgi:hypothetical protein